MVFAVSARVRKLAYYGLLPPVMNIAYRQVQSKGLLGKKHVADIKTSYACSHQEPNSNFGVLDLSRAAKAAVYC